MCVLMVQIMLELVRERCAQWLMDVAGAVRATFCTYAMQGLTHRGSGSEVTASAQHRYQ